MALADINVMSVVVVVQNSLHHKDLTCLLAFWRYAGMQLQSVPLLSHRHRLELQSVFLIVVLQFRQCLLWVVRRFHHRCTSMHFSIGKCTTCYGMAWPPPLLAPAHKRQLSCIVWHGMVPSWYGHTKTTCNLHLSCMVRYGILPSWYGHTNTTSGTSMQSAIVLYGYDSIMVWYSMVALRYGHTKTTSGTSMQLAIVWRKRLWCGDVVWPVA